MVQAIGSSAISAATNAGAAAASLEAQLVRYQKQLSECVNCDSSKTAEGKAEIQAISVRISEVRERIDKVTGVKPGSQTTELATSTSTGINANGDPVALAESDNVNASPVSASKSAYSTTGSRVDVLA